MKYVSITVSSLPETAPPDWRNGLIRCFHLKHLALIPDYDDYAVRSDGFVVRYKQRSDKRIKPKTIKNHIGRNGYCCVNITSSSDGKQRRLYTHRLVAQAFIDNALNKPQVAHIDGNRENPHVLNLRWSTQKENEQDKIRHGTNRRIPKGSRVFSNSQCDEISDLHKQGLSMRKIAIKYGVTHNTIKTALIYGSVQ